MIYLSDNTKNKIDILNYDEAFVVADFDRTITMNSSSSWDVLETSDFVCAEYTKDAKNLLDYYYPIEIDNNINPITKSELMHEWWNKVFELFVKYGLKEEIVNNATSNIQTMNFRDGGKEFLTTMYEKEVPVIIISAGVGNFIKQFFKYHNCMFPNIHLISNFIKFENGIAVGVEDTMIHTFNKDIVVLDSYILEKIKNRKDILLLGDSLADVKMVPEEKRPNTIRIGFLEYNIDKNLDEYRKEFDIVCTNNTSFNELRKVLKLK